MYVKKLKKSMSQFRRNFLILGFIIGIVALGFLTFIDWRIALGVVLWTWSINIEKEARKYDK